MKSDTKKIWTLNTGKILFLYFLKFYLLVTVIFEEDSTFLKPWQIWHTDNKCCLNKTCRHKGIFNSNVNPKITAHNEQLTCIEFINAAEKWGRNRNRRTRKKREIATTAADRRTIDQQQKRHSLYSSQLDMLYDADIYG